MVKRAICVLFAVCLCLSLLTGTVRAVGRFVDVTGNDWFHATVEYACETGIMRGVSENTFQPNSGADRTTLVTALYNYSLLKDFDVSSMQEIRERLQ